MGTRPPLCKNRLRFCQEEGTDKLIDFPFSHVEASTVQALPVLWGSALPWCLCSSCESAVWGSGQVSRGSSVGPEERLEPGEPRAGVVTGHEREEPVFFEEMLFWVFGPWQALSRPQLRIALYRLVPEKSWAEGAFQAWASLSAVLEDCSSQRLRLVVTMRAPDPSH